MADIELVIKMSEGDYERLKEYEKAPFNSLTSRVYEAIANGTPLPVNHGRLIDADELIKWLKLYDDRYNKRFAKTPIKDIPMYDLGHRNRNDAVILKIDRFPTIIEAESGGE